MAKNWIQSFVRLVRKDMSQYPDDAVTRREVYQKVRIKNTRKKQRRQERDKSYDLHTGSRNGKKRSGSRI